MSRHPANKYSLVADIGGTNTRVALAKSTRILPETVRKYSNSEFPGLETVLRRYVEEEDNVDCTSACVAVAGPVRNGVGELTNLDWTIDNETLVRATRAERVAILNDLQAQGHALGHLDPSKVRQIISGATARPGATQLVIGVGTGFNAAAVIDTDHGRFVPPSECGHANLPIRNDEELRLCQYVESAHGFPAVEDVLSGRGLERVYRWLGHEAGDEREMGAAEIMEGVNEGADDRAAEAVRFFVRMLGTVAGNLSLIHLPFGGVYLIGGVARAMTPHLDQFGFETAFRDKGRFAGFMGNFSVSVIEDDFAALIGCASFLAASAKA
jgi:glucokinase